MTTPDPDPFSLEFRVRYAECDPMGLAHHSTYPIWFEMGRTELLRAHGASYRDIEAQGLFLAVVKLNIRYRAPARYDDLLRLDISLARVNRVKLEHEYALHRDGLLLTTASTTLACINRAGVLQPMPDVLLALSPASCTT
jgi:acyl-CoA thioester hydrolase